MSRYETFKVVMKDGSYVPYFCKKEELLNYMTVRHYRDCDHIEIWNRDSDKTKHRIIRKEDLK